MAKTNYAHLIAKCKKLKKLDYFNWGKKREICMEENWNQSKFRRNYFMRSEFVPAGRFTYRIIRLISIIENMKIKCNYKEFKWCTKQESWKKTVWIMENMPHPREEINIWEL